MKIISDAEILSLNISPAQCVEWVRQSFAEKKNADLPAKVMQHLPGNVFFNTMPCIVSRLNLYGVKIISRHPGASPSLRSVISLFDLNSGIQTALMNGNWITAMRTGAVAALATKVLCSDFASASIGMVGLGAMARSTIKCLASQFKTVHDVVLLRYKDHAERFIRDCEDLDHVNFHIVDSKEELVRQTSVLISCVTSMDEQFLPAQSYPPGYLLVPVHTRGFQDCDLVFDRVVADDENHVRNFKNFSRFLQFAEFDEVLSGRLTGRSSNNERIISYNIGLGLHDVYFAHKILSELSR